MVANFITNKDNQIFCNNIFAVATTPSSGKKANR